jgi:predicted dienelactone hydrolase
VRAVSAAAAAAHARAAGPLVVGAAGFAPPLSQQLVPFASLKQPGRMLALVNNATHLSFLNGSARLPVFVVGPDRPEAYQELKGLSLAFFDQYLRSGHLLDQLVPATGGIQRGEAPLNVLLRRQLSAADLDSVLK